MGQGHRPLVLIWEEQDQAPVEAPGLRAGWTGAVAWSGSGLTWRSRGVTGISPALGWCVFQEQGLFQTRVCIRGCCVWTRRPLQPGLEY